MIAKRVLFVFLVTVTSIEVEGQAKDVLGSRCIVKYTYEEGHCENYDDCPTAEKDFKNGFKPTYCNGVDSNGVILTCCRDSSLDGQNIEQKLGEDEPERPKRVSDLKCEEYSKVVQRVVKVTVLTAEPVTLELSDPICYIGVGLIVGGKEAQVAEFPHMAAVGFSTEEDEYLFLCGGTLISRGFVLTAGHCNQSSQARKDSPQPVVVRLGAHKLGDQPRDGAKAIDVRIRRIHMHPEYNPPVIYNDIALLELETDVQFSMYIRPACLWTRNDVGHYVKGTASGWGATNVLQKKLSDILMKVALPFLANDFCNEKLINLKNRNWHGFLESNSQMCAGELDGGKDTCQGDSGGPLQVMSRDNKCVHYVVGVTSVGRGCGEKDFPAIYTRVSAYLDWIEGIVWPDG